LGEILRLVADFTSDISGHVEGTPSPDGLMQSIRPAQLRFRRAIRDTAPEFRPYERRVAHNRSLPAPEFLTNEQEDNDPDSLDEDVICIDEVFKRAQMYVLSLFSVV
jgi:hypothetical protein